MKETRFLLGFLCLPLFTYNSVPAQIYSEFGTYIDDRDGTTYQTLTVDSTIWIAENLKYRTETSEDHSENQHGVEIDGYFYLHDELENVCPVDFRLPTTLEWETYVQYLIELKEIPDSSYYSFSKRKKGDELIGVIVRDNLLATFEDPNPLNLNGDGHTEGGRLIALGSTNFWIRHTDSNDPKYHVHLDEDGYSVHTHNYNIIDREKKIRKFSVRCVSDSIEK